MSKEEPKNGELKIMLDFLKEAVQRIEETGKDTNAKASYTNGRVTKLEDAVKAITDLIQKHDKALFDEDKGVISIMQQVKGSLTLGKIIVGIMVVIVPTAVGLYIKDFKSRVASEVLSTIKSEYNIAVK